MQQNLQNKAGLVEGVFNKVYDKYDLMNDFMSFGIHRLWKKNLMNWMSPTKNKKYLDVACGTGDLGKLFLDNTDKNGEIFSSDSNVKMIEKGKKRLSKYKNITVDNATYETITKLQTKLTQDVKLSRSQVVKTLVNEKARKLNGRISK